MPMIPMRVDDSTLIATSAISAAITYGFCVSVAEMEPTSSLVAAAAVGIVLYSIGVIPIGILIAVGFAMIVAIFKSDGSGTRSPESSPNPGAPSQEIQKPPVGPHNVLSPFRNLSEAKPQLVRHLAQGKQVPAILKLLFPLMPFSHVHDLNTFYVTLRAAGKSKEDALLTALDNYMQSIGGEGL